MSKISLISQFFFPSESSTAQLMTDLSLGLAARGHSLTVITSTASNSKSNFPSIKIIRLPRVFLEEKKLFNKGLNSLLFLIEGIFYVLFRVPKDNQLLIASNPPYAGIIGILFKLFRRGKYCFILQDIFPESAALSKIFKSNGIAFSFFSFVVRQICCLSSTTIVLTDAMKLFLEKKYPILKQLKNVTVIENWSIVNITTCNKQNNPFAIHHQLESVFTVLYSGNMGRLHDILSLAEAIRILRNEKIKFVCIGNGVKRSIFETYKSNYYLDNLILLPFQSRNDISLTHTACDVSIVSLIDGAECIIAPCKLYSILSSGRAIVSISRIGSYLDNLLTSYNCGVNCPPNNPELLASLLLNLANDHEMVGRMGQNARNLYELNYQLDRAIANYHSLFEEPLHS